eukprot:3830593-Rhodomonas_salina.1
MRLCSVAACSGYISWHFAWEHTEYAQPKAALLHQMQDLIGTRKRAVCRVCCWTRVLESDCGERRVRGRAEHGMAWREAGWDAR